MRKEFKNRLGFLAAVARLARWNEIRRPISASAPKGNHMVARCLSKRQCHSAIPAPRSPENKARDPLRNSVRPFGSPPCELHLSPRLVNPHSVGGAPSLMFSKDLFSVAPVVGFRRFGIATFLWMCLSPSCVSCALLLAIFGIPRTAISSALFFIFCVAFSRASTAAFFIATLPIHAKGTLSPMVFALLDPALAITRTVSLTFLVQIPQTVGFFVGGDAVGMPQAIAPYAFSLLCGFRRCARLFFVHALVQSVREFCGGLRSFNFAALCVLENSTNG